MTHTINKNYGMEDILLIIPQGDYGRKVPNTEEYINHYKDQSVGAIGFSYNNNGAAAGAEMGINKFIVDIVRRLLPSNVWQTHLVESTEDNKSLKDVTTHNIIQSIQTESIKNWSQDTNTGLLKRHSAPQWGEGIRTYSMAITKNEYKLTKMGFTTDYAVLVHHIKFHLEKFYQTPQGTSFTKLLNNCEKIYGYGYNYTKVQFYQLIATVTIADDKLRQAPGYSKNNDIINGRTTEIPSPTPWDSADKRFSKRASSQESNMPWESTTTHQWR